MNHQTMHIVNSLQFCVGSGEMKTFRIVFLGIIRLARGDAESLMTAIDAFLVAKGIDIKKRFI